jgi:hypothetical protein
LLELKLSISTSIAQELEGKMDETNATAQEVRNILKTMESANKKDDKPGSSEARIRQNMQVTLAKKFMDLMSECVSIPFCPSRVMFLGILR